MKEAPGFVTQRVSYATLLIFICFRPENGGKITANWPENFDDLYSYDDAVVVKKWHNL